LAQTSWFASLVRGEMEAGDASRLLITPPCMTTSVNPQAGYAQFCGNNADDHSAPFLPAKSFGRIKRLAGRALLLVIFCLGIAVVFRFFAPAPRPLPCEVNIILVRHCDKNPPWDPDPTPFEACSVRGEMRGVHLAQIFGPGGAFPKPTELFARRLGAGLYASRDMYLLWPLAQRLGLWINATYQQTDISGFAAALLANREAMCSSTASTASMVPTALVSWNHCFLPALSQALGCHDTFCMTCWDDNNYESVLTLNFKRNTSGHWSMNPSVKSQNFSQAFPPTTPFLYKECTIKTSSDQGDNLIHQCTAPQFGGPPAPAVGSAPHS